MRGGVSRRGRSLIGAAALIAALAASGEAVATPGDLDPGFGEHGTQRISFKDAPYYSTVGSLIGVQPSGSPVLAGALRYHYVEHIFEETRVTFAATRLNDDGTLDPGFGSGGLILGGLGFGEGDPFYSETSTALAQDGSILVGGLNGNAYSVARLTPDGVLDPSFGEDGVSSFPLTNRFPVRAKIVVLSDGSVVLAGIDNPAAGFAYRLVLIKFNADGTIDSSFGTDGQIATPPEDQRSLNGLAVDSKDRILVSDGIARGFNGPRESVEELARFMPDGQPDPSFATDGVKRVVTPTEYPIASGPDLMIDSDQRIYAISSRSLTRLSEDGSVDESFGTDGTLDLPDWGVLASGWRVHPDPAGGLFLGTSSPGPTSALVIGHLLDNGSGDPAFGDDGWSITYHDESLGSTSMLLRPHDRLLVAAAGKPELIARFRLDEGGASDRDADGVEDPEDRCPDRSGSSLSGCPTFSSSIEITRWSSGRRPDRLPGVIVSVSADNRCLEGREIRLFKRRDRELVETAEVSYPDFVAVGVRTTKLFIRTSRTLRGHVFAVARGLRNPRLGVCESSRSESFLIPGSR